MLVVGPLASPREGRAQAMSMGHSLGCDLCHQGHVPRISHAGRLVMATRTATSGPTLVAPPGMTALAKSCLRCHYSTATRTAEMTAAQLAATGGVSLGKYVGGTLFTSHPMGANGQPQCANCHEVHRAGLLLPQGMQQRTMCTSCHTDQSNHPDAQHLTVACSTCHTIHTTNFGTRIAGPVIVGRARERVVPLSTMVNDATGRPAPPGQAHVASLGRDDIDRRCIACHADRARADRTAFASAVQIDLSHIQRGSCTRCHRARWR